MNNENTHYVLRNGKKDRRGLSPVYARIIVNGTRCELALKHYLSTNNWDIGKGRAKPKSPELKQFNAYLEDSAENWQEATVNFRCGIACLLRQPPVVCFIGGKKFRNLNRINMYN